MFDPLPFGRERNDRGPLLFGAAAAVLLHVLAVFIPLPEGVEIQAPPRVPETEVRIVDVPLPAPDLPDPPPVTVTPARNVRRIPLPPMEAPEVVAVIEPDAIAETPADIVDGMPDWIPSELEPPPSIGVVDELTDGLVPPVCIHKPTPEFPHAGTWIRQSGLVILQAVIDREGNVTEIELVDVTDPDLGYSDSAIEAVRRWRYRPGELHGRPVAVRLTVRVEFTVN